MTATKTVRPQLTDNGVKAIGIVFGSWTAMVGIQRDEKVEVQRIQTQGYKK